MADLLPPPKAPNWTEQEPLHLKEPHGLQGARLWPLGVLAANLLLVLLCVVPLMDAFSQRDVGALLVYTCLGAIPVLAACLSGFLAWGSGRFWVRLLLHWQLAIDAVGVWLLGFMISDEMHSIDNAVEVVLPVLPLVALAVQTPLWVVRQWFGWRLLRGEFGDVPSERKLSIGDLFIATLVVAISLGILRAAGDREWEGWTIAFVTCLAASFAILLPVAWWLLAFDDLGRGAVWTLLYAAVGMIAVWVIAWLVEGNIWGDVWELSCFCYAILVFAGTLIFAGWAVRAAGYRLERT